MTLTLTTLDLLFLASIVGGIGGWGGTLYFGFSETGPKWLLPACLVLFVVSAITFVGTVLYWIING